jgi:hypothetical protein
VSLSTRILVVHEGRLMGDIAAEDASEDVLLRMAAGNADRTATHSPQHSGATL